MKKKSNFSEIISSILLGNKSYIILLLLVISLSIVSPLFLKRANILNVLRQICVSAIACAGFTLILGSGHMDLSVGMILCFSGVIAAKLSVAGVPLLLVIIITILFGALLGGINATIITTFGLPGFIVTLATSSVYQGIAYIITKNIPVNGLAQDFIALGQGYLLGIPTPIYIMAAALIIMWVILNRTKFGRHAIAMGGNNEAARVSGIRIENVRLGVFMMLGGYTGLAAVIQTARSASAQLSAGASLSMDAIAAVVIGGTSMKGGNANIIGSLAGCLIVGIVGNGLNLLHVDANWQIVAKGALILLAVVLDSVSTRIYAKMSTRKSAK